MRLEKDSRSILEQMGSAVGLLAENARLCE